MLLKIVGLSFCFNLYSVCVCMDTTIWCLKCWMMAFYDRLFILTTFVIYHSFILCMQRLSQLNENVLEYKVEKLRERKKNNCVCINFNSFSIILYYTTALFHFFFQLLLFFFCSLSVSICGPYFIDCCKAWLACQTIDINSGHNHLWCTLYNTNFLAFFCCCCCASFVYAVVIYHFASCCKFMLKTFHHMIRDVVVFFFIVFYFWHELAHFRHHKTEKIIFCVDGATFI